MYTHDLISLPTLERVDGERRHYITPTGEKYPSVTTVLDKTSDKSNLIAWRNRIGDVQANIITKKATTRGTLIHNMLEKHILNEQVNIEEEVQNKYEDEQTQKTIVKMYRQVENVLQTHVTDVRSAEGQLFSHKLKVAGSCDLIASYDGRPAIIDYKTSVKNKQKQWIQNYFMQASLYSFMFWEMTKIHHPLIVIIIAIEQEQYPQVFVDNASSYIDLARSKCQLYHTMYPTNILTG